MERLFKIHPQVTCCSYKYGTLTDKNREYPESTWNEGEAKEYVAKGFLVEVTPEKKAPEPEEEKPLEESEKKSESETENPDSNSEKESEKKEPEKRNKKN